MSDQHEIIAAEAVAVARPAQQLHPMVEAAMAQSPTPETLREFLAVQREWEADQARKAYARAMVALKGELPAVIGRDARVSFGEGKSAYSHSTLAGIMRTIAPILTRHGFTLSWVPEVDEKRIAVTCKLLHADGHSESCTVQGPPDTSGSKNAVQARGSTMTYLARYSAVLLLGLTTGDAPDADDHPRREAPPSTVDQQANLRAAAAIRKRGRKVEDAEALVGRKVKDWTAEDLGQIRAWLQPQREPGCEG